MSLDLNAIMSQIGRDKGIDREFLVETVESAMLSAARKHYGHGLNLETQFDQDTNEVEVIQFKTVVEKVEDNDTQISLTQARAEFDPDAMVGDELGNKLDTSMLGRIAAQTAKQVIIQKLRDAERGVIFEEYKDSKGELINGIVQRYDRGNLIVNLGRTEAILPRREQISRERYRQGDRVRGMILDIDRSARGPQIVLTRSHPEFLRKLFELEVPEISEGVIEIKNVAREPGERAKIAVFSNEPNIDPVGACVGIKGSRVQAVVQELRGERIDIIPWTPDEPSFIARALQPAEVTRVVLDDDDHSMEVIVADDQLSLAIGRRGQNVKLASKLTGWRIDVRSISAAEEEAKQARASLERIPGLDFTMTELLFQEGYRSSREIADANVEDVADIEGFDLEKAQSIVEAARALVDSLPADDEEKVEQVSTTERRTDLDKLMLPNDIRAKLLNSGMDSIQTLVEMEDYDLSVRAMLSSEDLAKVRDATDHFLKSGSAQRMERAS